MPVQATEKSSSVMPVKSSRNPVSLDNILTDQVEREKGRKWIHEVEIFATGFYNGQNWTKSDLSGMVDAYWATRELVDPVLVLNHDDSINWGFVCNFHLNEKSFTDWRGKLVQPGERIFASILADESIYDDIVAHKYRRPSVELYPDYIDENNGNVWPWLIDAVSIQGGANLEAVRTLKPIAMSARETATKKSFSALHFKRDGKAILIRFQDEKGSNMEEVLKAIADLTEKFAQAQVANNARFDKLEALQKEDIAGESKDPANDPNAMKDAVKCEDKEKPKAMEDMGDKKAESSTDMKDAIASVEKKMEQKFGDILRSQSKEIAAMRDRDAKELRSKNVIRPAIAKFADVKTLKIPPEKIDNIVEFASSLDHGKDARRVKFADMKGASSEVSQYDAFMGILEGLPNQAGMLNRQSQDLRRPTPEFVESGSFSPKQFFADATAKAAKENREAWQVINEEVEKLDAEKYVAAMLYGGSGE